MESVSTVKKPSLDIIVIALILLFAITLVVFTTLTRSEGAYVEVAIDGNVVATYSLSEDGVYTLNGGTNVLTVKDGVAYMTHSDCPDHTCENTGKVKYVGKTIVCLPNRLSVTVAGNADDSVDFVT